MNWMRLFVAAAVVCIFSVCSSQTVLAERKKFLIPPFENLSPCKVRTEYEVTYNDSKKPDIIIKKSIKIDQYSEAARSLLEDRMEDMNAKIIERSRVDQMLSESEFTHRNGYVNEESALEMGVLAGADTLMMGTILNIQDEDEIVTAYDTKEQIKKTICSIRVRIIDIQSGNVLFSKRAKGEAISTASDHGGKTNSDSAYTALESSIDNLFDITSFEKNIQKYINK
ncbi:MAG: hypothetical protein D3922_06065 [Candidatus Electrothrix sp. AR1]|nr:hypothetical protein [Candidatus Electrothrix sp. AR1]